MSTANPDTEKAPRHYPRRTARILAVAMIAAVSACGGGGSGGSDGGGQTSVSSSSDTDSSSSESSTAISSSSSLSSSSSSVHSSSSNANSSNSSSSSSAIVSYEVQASTGNGGSASPTQVTVSEGETTTIDIAPDTGYSIDTVSGCGGSLSGNVYTTGAVMSDCTVTASFSLNPPTAPELTLTPEAIRTFHFSWADLATETDYRLLENPDGVSGYSELASLTADTTHYDHRVSLHRRLNASYILEACNSAGCTDSASVSVSGSLSDAVGYFKASGSDALEQFGVEVALSADGDHMAIGAFRGDTEDTESNAGVVYTFVRYEDSGWEYEASAYAPHSDTYDRFGDAVALSADGNTLAVGAWRESSAATGIDGDATDNTAANSGAAYVFNRTALLDADDNTVVTWMPEAYIKASNAEEDDRFGFSVALSDDGNTLAVGAPDEESPATHSQTVFFPIESNPAEDNSANSPGAAYVFTRDSSFNWSQERYVKAANTDADSADHFGFAVALSGDGQTLAVGDKFEDSSATGIDGDGADNSAGNSGAVYLYHHDSSAGFLQDAWPATAYIKPHNTGAYDYFGSSLSLSQSGDLLAVGAPGEDAKTVGIDGSDNNAAEDSGAAYTFARDAGGWSQAAYIKASNTDVDSEFGEAVALSADGSHLVVTAIGEASGKRGVHQYAGGDSDEPNSGAAYLYLSNGASWTYERYLKASNTQADDRFGTAAAVSSDGASILVGATHEQSNAAGVDSDQSDNSTQARGAAYLY